MEEVSAETVRAQLARILASRGFLGSIRLQRFLRYIVEQSLTEQAPNLKEYTIALEVFDRRPDYDPKVDAIVRVEARRLRAKLAEYYEGSGTGDPIRIELPTGSYIPVFRQSRLAQEPIPARVPALLTRRLGVPIALGAALSLAAGLLLWGLRGREQPRPEVVRLVRDAGSSREPAISADGNLLAYSSDQSGNFEIWVRRLDASDALQLTRHEATDSEPDISQDGSRIVFRSERDGGGVYIVPVFGGEERLLVRDGRAPRFSPDGRFVAYWLGSPYLPNARSYIIDSAGGTPKRIAAELRDARTPAWGPDSSTLLVQMQDRSQVEVDYSLSFVDGRRSQTTGWREAVSAARLAQVRSRPFWDGRTLYFSALASPRPTGDFTGVSQEVVNIWEIKLDARTGRVEGQPRQLTYGASSERDPVISRSGQLIYTAVQYSLTAAYLSLKDSGGNLHPLFQGPGSYVSAFAPPSGASAVAMSDRSGHMDIWIRRMDGTDERALTATVAVERYPLLSRDGSYVYFGVREPAYATYRLKVDGGSPDKICADCGMLTDITPEGRFLLFEKGSPYAAGLLDTRTGATTLVVTHPGGVYLPRLSPDGRWLVFQAPGPGANLSIYVAPFSGAAPLPPRTWTRITDGNTIDWAPAWSADGSSIYYLSDRDGSRCVWMQRVTTRGKSAAGPPIALKHLHSGTARIPTDVDPAVFRLSPTPDRVVLTYMQSSSSLYIAGLR